jgi:DEAD/DEAH box helicase domain-containing protein
MALRTLLSHWRADPTFAPNVAAWKTLPAQPGTSHAFPPDLAPQLEKALRRKGITSLYAHQARSWEILQQGGNAALVTGTASGKTLAYNLPILDALLKDPDSRALYLFPTKALGHDQLAELEDLSPLPAGAYDGDTPGHVRPRVRTNARIISTNPDMLHLGILPHHPTWESFFSHLKYIVVDEMHTYRGVFGAHVANVIRRLKRIAHHYGSHPQFALTSATIGNPRELAQTLIEEPVELITQDGSARGRKHFLLYNPPVSDEKLGLRVGSQTESVRLMNDLLAYDVQSILFGRSRRSVEWMLQRIRERSPDADPVRAYRSGYLPQQRRKIEAGLRQGSVRAVVGTTALELGIDIGGMDAAVLAGYPGTIAGTWQQAGRAGRGKEDALAILVASANPLDQYLMRHPEYFFQRSPEQALLDPNNLLILLDHIRCAAYELPFQIGETYGDLSPDRTAEFLNILQNQGALHQSEETFFWMSEEYPAHEFSLRSTPGKQILLRLDEPGETTLIGKIDTASAHWMTHPGAIYLHGGDIYRVEDLDLEGGTARLTRSKGDYYTEAVKDTQVSCDQVLHTAQIPGGHLSHGELSVTSQVVGFHKFAWDSHEKLAYQELELPETTLRTTGYWFTLSEETVQALKDEGQWSSDRNEYGPGWETARQQARQRDQFRCQVCGQEEKETQHHVHHKRPFRLFDSPAEANRLENLVTLCPRCHSRAENVVRIRSGLSGLAYTLGYLAPLILMCDRHDLGLHTDPHSPLGNGQPTVVIYEQIPAGIGFSKRLYENHDLLVQQAFDLVQSCPCQSGCPSCVGPGGEAGAGGKAETLAILKKLRP